jgi:hypothetical protein
MISTLSENYSRAFLPGDETSIVSLFNSQNENLAGFVPRTVDYWRWSCLNRPDVDEKGISVAVNGKDTVGYIVVGKSGNVWELCYDSRYDGKAIVTRLINWALDYVKGLGTDSIVLSAFVGDQVVRDVCQELDFAEAPPEPMFLSVLDLPELICKILKVKQPRLGLKGSFWFDLKDCPPWCIGSFGLKLEENDVTILNEPPVSKITIDTEMTTIVAIIFGIEDVKKAILTSRVRFHPLLKINSVNKFLKSLQTNNPWFIPRADIG